MKEERREKRIAVMVSLAVHLAVFAAAAGSNIFSVLQRHVQVQPVEVILYHEDSQYDSPRAGMGKTDQMLYSRPDFLPDVNSENIEGEKRKNDNQESLQDGTEQQLSTLALDEPVRSTAASHSGGALVRGAKGAMSSDSGTGNAGYGEADGEGALSPVKAALIYIPDVRTYYPEDLRRKHITGVVNVRIIIDAGGTVTDAAVSSSSGYDEMDNAALPIARQCRYEPARDASGQPVISRRNLNIPFEIN